MKQLVNGEMLIELDHNIYNSHTRIQTSLDTLCAECCDTDLVVNAVDLSVLGLDLTAHVNGHIPQITQHTADLRQVFLHFILSSIISYPIETKKYKKNLSMYWVNCIHLLPWVPMLMMYHAILQQTLDISKVYTVSAYRNEAIWISFKLK